MIKDFKSTEKKKIDEHYSHIGDLMMDSSIPVILFLTAVAGVFFNIGYSMRDIFALADKVLVIISSYGEIALFFFAVTIMYLLYKLFKLIISFVHFLILGISLFLTSDKIKSFISMALSISLFSFFAWKSFDKKVVETIQASSKMYILQKLGNQGDLLSGKISLKNKFLDTFRPWEWDCKVENKYKNISVSMECVLVSVEEVNFKIIETSKDKKDKEIMFIPKISTENKTDNIEIESPNLETLAMLRPYLCPDRNIVTYRKIKDMKYVKKIRKEYLLNSEKTVSISDGIVEVGKIINLSSCLDVKIDKLYINLSEMESSFQGFTKIDTSI